MTLEIRAATPTDSNAIWDMLRPVFRAGDTYAIDPQITRDEALAYWLAERVFVAEDETGPLGTYYIQRNRPGGGAHYCNCGFVTAAAAQGKGVARAMLGHALETATAAGFEGMVFNFVVESNARAVALWQRHGFEIVGRVPGAFRPAGTHQQSDALIMFARLR